MKTYILTFFLMTTFILACAQDGNSNLFVCKLTIGAAFGNTPGDVLKNTTSSHAQYLDQLDKQGQLVLAGRTQLEPTHPQNFGIIVMKAVNIKEVQRLRDERPGRSGWFA